MHAGGDRAGNRCGGATGYLVDGNAALGSKPGDAGWNTHARHGRTVGGRSHSCLSAAEGRITGSIHSVMGRRRNRIRRRSGLGLTGVGGGVFLAPILIALHWASPKQTAALSAPFILANSAVGLVGAIYAGQMPSGDTWLYAVGALAGAMIRDDGGSSWLSQAVTRYVLLRF